MFTGTGDDRFVPEPCNRIPSGGLLSLGALNHNAEKEIGVEPHAFQMGELTRAPGEFGRRTATPLYAFMLGQSGVRVAAAGVADLAFGTDFVRRDLGTMTDQANVRLLCANAVDAEGRMLLRARALLGGRSDAKGGLAVGVVSVVHESLQVELRRLGSDVVLLPAATAARDAFARMRAEADDSAFRVDTAVLLVHGTVAQAAEIAQAAPGYNVAVALRGGVLPEREPTVADGTTIFFARRGFRFAWRVVVCHDGPDGVLHELVRIGERLLTLTSPIGTDLLRMRSMTDGILTETHRNAGWRPAHPDGEDYVGAAKCRECHPQEAEHAGSAHARTVGTRLLEPNRASTQCLACHATGLAWRTGFGGVEDERKDLGGVSCESCHGPGSAHVENPAKGWGAVPPDSCYRCHLPERSPGLEAESVWAASGYK